MEEIKLSELKEPFKVYNTFAGTLAHGSFVIDYNGYRILDPKITRQDLLDALEFFHKRGQVRFEFDVQLEGEKKEGLEHADVVNEKKSVIFNPKDNLINVEEIDTTGKTVEVGKSELDRVEESQAFLSQHWKTIERDLPTLSKEEVHQHLRVAKQDGLTGKKVELLEGQLEQLS